MFEVGFTELLVVFALALVVLGPERLPRLTAKVGRWIGRARTMARQFRDQLEAEANIEDPFASQPQPQSQPAHAASTAPPSATDAEPARDPAPESPHERGP